MARRIVIIQGHPDPDTGHFCHALADAYATGAREAGHEVRRIDVAWLHFPWIRNKDEFDSSEVPPAIREAQESIRWADHLVIVFPIWLGTLPSLLKAFLEQTLRPGFAVKMDPGKLPEKLLKGRSARIIVSMGMPALAYRWFYRAHGLKNLQRNILHFCGIRPAPATLIGLVESAAGGHQAGLKRVRALGIRGR